VREREKRERKGVRETFVFLFFFFDPRAACVRVARGATEKERKRESGVSVLIKISERAEPTTKKKRVQREEEV